MEGSFIPFSFIFCLSGIFTMRIYSGWYTWELENKENTKKRAARVYLLWSCLLHLWLPQHYCTAWVPTQGEGLEGKASSWVRWIMDISVFLRQLIPCDNIVVMARISKSTSPPLWQSSGKAVIHRAALLLGHRGQQLLAALTTGHSSWPQCAHLFPFI